MSKVRRSVRAAMATLLAVAGTAALPGAVHAAHPNWLTTIAVTESGSHVLGNPDAGVKVTEWVSYTCSHCAHFQRASEAPLRLAYVQPGKVSVEVRHLVRDPVDLTVAMLANCGDPKKFFANHHLFLQTQDTWLKAASRAGAAQQQRWANGPMAGRFRAIASDLGLFAIMERRGYTRADADRCLTDEAMTRRLVAERQAAGEQGVQGTPSFLLNGALLDDTHDWPGLEAAIKARL
ncbi:MAG: DsbA family protein [Novosphingobium sp.]|nr:DsbA family protein [Novosphingobium sp.]